MDQQPMRVTFLLLALILVVGVAQVWLGDLQTSVEAAGLLKTDGQPLWRFLTSPFLHGNFLHGGLNAAGLWYLGRRTESLMGWPHLLLGFFIAMVAGGVATDYFVPDRPSIGASGGVLGVLGMLLGFELLHQKLVPKSARRRLAAGVLATFAIGASTQGKPTRSGGGNYGRGGSNRFCLVGILDDGSVLMPCGLS